MVVTPVVTAGDETINPDPDQTITVPEWTLNENEMTTQDYNITTIAYTEPEENLTLSPSIDDYEFEVGFIDDGEPSQAFDDELEYIHPIDSGHIIKSDGNPGSHLFVLRDGSIDHDVLPVVISEYSITAEYVPKNVSVDDEDPLITVAVDNPDDEIDGVEIGAEFDGEPVRTEASSIGNGTYQATIDIPESTPEGEYSIHAAVLGSSEYEGFQERPALSTVGSINVESSDADDSDNGNDESGDSGSDGDNDTPEVTIVSPESAAVTEPVLFDANITGTDEDPEYDWTIDNQTYTDSIPNHTFTKSGEHQISLTATFEENIVNDTATITISDESSPNDSDTSQNESGPQQPDLDDDDASDDALALSPAVIVAGFVGLLVILIYRTE